MVKYYVARARFLPNSCFYFTHTPTKNCEFPVINVVNPADYNIYEVTEEEYMEHTNKK
jgi:hypothetical protein